MTAILSTVDFANPYFPVLVLLAIALVMSVGFVFLSQALGPKKYDRIKYGVYECGVDPVDKVPSHGVVTKANVKKFHGEWPG